MSENRIGADPEFVNQKGEESDSSFEKVNGIKDTPVHFHNTLKRVQLATSIDRARQIVQPFNEQYKGDPDKTGPTGTLRRIDGDDWLLEVWVPMTGEMGSFIDVIGRSQRSVGRAPIELKGAQDLGDGRIRMMYGRANDAKQDEAGSTEMYDSPINVPELQEWDRSVIEEIVGNLHHKKLLAIALFDHNDKMSIEDLNSLAPKRITAQLLPTQLSRGVLNLYPDPKAFIKRGRAFIDRISEVAKKQEYEKDLQRLAKLIYGDKAGKIEIGLKTNAVLLIPLIGFGLSVALSGVVALNHLPFGQMAQRSETRISANSASADQWGSMAGYGFNSAYNQVLYDECMSAFQMAVDMCYTGNPYGCEGADELGSEDSLCAQFVN